MLSETQNSIHWKLKIISEATTLIPINQYNTDKQKLEKKFKMLIKKNRCNLFSDYYCFEIKKCCKVENKTPNGSGLV